MAERVVGCHEPWMYFDSARSRGVALKLCHESLSVGQSDCSRRPFHGDKPAARTAMRLSFRAIVEPFRKPNLSLNSHSQMEKGLTQPSPLVVAHTGSRQPFAAT